MDINDAEKFVYARGMWERGCSDAMAKSIEMVEKFLCRDGVTAQQREALLALYHSLIEAKNRS
jgi:hypothetical protein